MTEEKIINIIHNDILGLMTPEEEQLLQEWLEESDRNRALYDAVMKGENLSSRYNVFAAVDEKAAWEKFEREQFPQQPEFPQQSQSPQQPLKFILSQWRYAASAAVAVVMIALAAFWFNRNISDKSEVAQHIENVKLSPASERAQQEALNSGRQQASVIMNGKEMEVTSPEEFAELLENIPADETMEVTTNQKHEYWMTLPDGTRVHLSNNSRLKYPAHFSDNHREVILSGMATFKVARGKAPFIVATHDGIITDLGTEFLVNTNAEKGGTEVVLFSGKVSVDNKKDAPLMMAPGEKAEFATGTPITTSQADIPFYRAQSEGVFLFRNTSMKKIMTLIDHWYGVQTTFSKEELGNITFSGSLDKYGSLQSILDAIEAVTGLVISSSKDRIIINQGS